MGSFEEVIKEFQNKRLEKEINSQRVKVERQKELQELAERADSEMKVRRRRRKIKEINA